MPQWTRHSSFKTALLRASAIVCVATSLAACGGGGDSPLSFGGGGDSGGSAGFAGSGGASGFSTFSTADGTLEAVSDTTGDGVGTALYAVGDTLLLAGDTVNPTGTGALAPADNLLIRVAGQVDNLGQALDANGLAGLPIVGETVGRITQRGDQVTNQLAKVVVLDIPVLGSRDPDSKQLIGAAAINSNEAHGDPTETSAIAAEAVADNQLLALGFDGKNLIAVPIDGDNNLQGLLGAIGTNGKLGQGGNILGLLTPNPNGNRPAGLLPRVGGVVSTVLTPIGDVVRGPTSTLANLRNKNGAPLLGGAQVAGGAGAGANAQAGNIGAQGGLLAGVRTLLGGQQK